MPLRDVNLLPKFERQHSGGGWLSIFLFIIVIIAMIIFIYAYFSTKSDLKKVEENYNRINEEVNLKETELETLQSEEGSNLETAVSFVDGHLILTSTLIVELNDLLAEYSYLTEYQYNTENVTITTNVEKLDNVAQYTTDLTVSQYLNDVKVNNISTFTIGDDEDEDSINIDVVPRYEAVYTLDINKRQLKGVAE